MKLNKKLTKSCIGLVTIARKNIKAKVNTVFDRAMSS
jgi:hypothetical protein